MGDVIYLFPNRDKPQVGRNGWNLDIDPTEFGNDKTALNEFIGQFKSSETRRNYRREIERLFRWADEIAQKPFCDLNARDYKQYAEFIANPPKHWQGNRIFHRIDATKMPFNSGGLSVSSQRTAFAVIRSFLSFLVTHRYLRAIPIYKGTVSDPPNETLLRENILEKQLDDVQTKALLEYVYSQTDRDSIRMRFFISLGLLLGLRIAEIANGQMKNFFEYNSIWQYRVVGKGKKVAHIEVPKKMIGELMRYRIAMQMTQLPDRHDSRPLFDLGVRRLTQLFKNSVVAAAESLPNGYAQDEMRKCTPHWLRHMYVKKLRKNKVARTDAMKLSRHEKAETNDLYDDSMIESRYAAIQDLTFDDVLSVD